MYSEHGFEALMRAVFLDVCQVLMVVSNCMPGSPQRQVASAISRSKSRALKRFTGVPVPTALVQKSVPFSQASMNSSLARTELLAF